MASHKWGEGPRRRRSPTNRGGLTFSRSQCDGHHSQGPQNRIFGLLLVALPTSNLTGVRSRGAIGHLGSCFPRFRALGPGAKRGPLADLPQREEKSAAPAPSSAGSGAALAIHGPLTPYVSPDLKLHVHAAMAALRVPRAREARGWRATPCMPVPNPALRGAARLRSAAVKLTDAVGLGPVLGKAQVVRHGFMILCACRAVLGLRAPGPAKSGKTKRDRGAGGHGFSS